MGCVLSKNGIEQDFREIVDVKAENWSKKYKRIKMDDVSN